MSGHLRVWAILAALAGAAQADPVQFGVWVDTSYSTGPVDTNGPSQRGEVHAFANGSAFLRRDLFFSDSGAGLAVGRDSDGRAQGSASEIKLYVDGTGGPAGTSGNSVIGARALFIDTLTFSGNFGAGVSIPFSAVLDGTWSATNVLGITTAPSGFSIAGVSIFVLPGNLPVDSASFGNLASVATLFGDWVPVSLYNNFDNVISPGLGPVAASVTDSFPIPVFDPVVRFVWFGQVIVGNNDPNNAYTGDFFNTGTLSFDFTGINVSSASGAFSNTPSTVPEPATHALLGVAVVIGAAVRRRIRRAG